VGRKIEVVPYDPSWPTAFELESARVSSVFESVLESITWAFNQGAQRFFEALGFSVFNVRMWKRGIST